MQHNRAVRMTVVLDELEDLCLERDGPIDKILRKSGKNRLFMILASQEYSAGKDRLGTLIGNCGMQLIFHPKDDCVDEVTKKYGIDRQHLAALEQGEFFAVGGLFNNRYGKNKQTTIHGKPYSAEAYLAPIEQTTETQDCRLPIEDKDKVGGDNSASIQNQKAMLRDYCIERGWDIYEIYTDDGFSGIDRTRPAFNRLLRDCEQGEIDIVLCKDQSRFSRDTVVIEQYLNDKFLEWGIRFIGVADNADTDNESYGTMRLFTSAYNEMYVKDISAKIRRTLAYKREQGQFIGSFAPYGYRIDPDDKHHLTVDPETATVVRMIFDLFVRGEGYRHIVQKLNGEGIVSPTAYKRQHGSKYTNCSAEIRLCPQSDSVFETVMITPAAAAVFYHYSVFRTDRIRTRILKIAYEPSAGGFLRIIGKAACVYCFPEIALPGFFPAI